jgi:hypothetical protein
MQGHFSFGQPPQAPGPQVSTRGLPSQTTFSTSRAEAITRSHHKPMSVSTQNRQNSLGPIQSVTTISKMGEGEHKETIREVPIYVEKIVDRPVIIEKKVEVPVERPVFIDKTVHVTREVPITIEKIIERPVEKTVIINRENPESQQKVNQCLAKIAQLENENRFLKSNKPTTTIIDTTREKTIKESQIVVNNAELNEAKSKILLLTKQCGELEATNRATNTSLSQRNDELNRIKREMDILRQNNRQLETQLSSRVQASDQNLINGLRLEFENKERHLLGEINRHNLNHSKALEELQKAQTKVAQLTSELDRNKQELQRVNNDAAVERFASQKLRCEVEEQKTKFESLNQATKHLNVQLTETVQRHEQEKETLRLKISELSQQAGQVYSLEQANLRLRHEKQIIENENQGLAQRLTLLTENKQTDVTKENIEKQKLSQELLRISEELRTANRQKLDLEERLSTRVHSLENELATRESSYQQAISEIGRNHNREAQTLSNQIEVTRLQLAESQTVIARLQTELQASQHAVGQQRRTIEELTAEKLALYQKLTENRRLNLQDENDLVSSNLIENINETEIREEIIARDTKRDSIDTSDNFRSSIASRRNVSSGRNEIEILMRNNLITLERQLTETSNRVKVYKAKNSNLKQTLMLTNLRLIASLSEIERLCRLSKTE